MRAACLGREEGRASMSVASLSYRSWYCPVMDEILVM